MQTIRSLWRAIKGYYRQGDKVSPAVPCWCIEKTSWRGEVVARGRF